MLEEIIHSQDMEPYQVSFDEGETIFLEGDVSKALYILISGRVEIYKGDMRLTETADTGAILGEMSYLMDSPRTATLKAGSPVEALRIPSRDLPEFLTRYPAVSLTISKILAHRLSETSHVLHGLREFSDHLPDAVLVTDRQGCILSWNEAARRLYGRDWDQMRERSVEEIFEDPEAFKSYLDLMQNGPTAAREEPVFVIQHPQKGRRWVSVNMTVLYDAHRNFQGVVAIGRDVTEFQRLQRRHRRTRYWIGAILALLVLLAGATIYGYPYFSKGYHAVQIVKHELRDQMAKDFLLLKSLLAQPLSHMDRPACEAVMRKFFKVQAASELPYLGLLVLDNDKRVFAAYSPHGDLSRVIGTTYKRIKFRGPTESLHKVLTLYRMDRDHPGGYRGVEVAFSLGGLAGEEGWLVFQINPKMLSQVYQLDEQALENFYFAEPQ